MSFDPFKMAKVEYIQHKVIYLARFIQFAAIALSL